MGGSPTSTTGAVVSPPLRSIRSRTCSAVERAAWKPSESASWREASLLPRSTDRVSNAASSATLGHAPVGHMDTAMRPEGKACALSSNEPAMERFRMKIPLSSDFKHICNMSEVRSGLRGLPACRIGRELREGRNTSMVCCIPSESRVMQPQPTGKSKFEQIFVVACARSRFLSPLFCL